MRIRTTVAAVLVATASSAGWAGVAHAGTDGRACPDFAEQRQAQAVLESPTGDPTRLDPDRDGVACEAWFVGRASVSVALRSEQTSTGPARQVSPVPRGGVDTGLDAARPVRSTPTQPAILLVAVFAVAATAAAGAAAAAARARA